MAAASNSVTICSLDNRKFQLRHKRKVESLAYGQSWKECITKYLKGNPNRVWKYIQPLKANIILYGKTPTSRRGHHIVRRFKN